MAWNPDQYLKFAQPRLRPAVDLLARIDQANPRHVVDLGCGAGNVTRLLRERWPAAHIAGVDDSAEMLAQAAKELPQVEWVLESIATWKPHESVDVLFSNAALHWLPEHTSLFPHLVGLLAPGGVLAVQMPRNFLAPSHTMIAATVHAGPWRSKLENLLGAPPVAESHVYYQILKPVVSSLDIWESEYLQVLRGEDPVKEWVKGTWLKQFLDRLEPEVREEFEADYARRLRAAYPPLPDGTTLFPFRRLFIIARR